MRKLQLGTTSITQHYSILLLIYRNTNSSADNYTAEFKLKWCQPNHQIFNSSLGTDPDSSWCCLPATRHVTRLCTPGEIPWDAGRFQTSAITKHGIQLEHTHCCAKGSTVFSSHYYRPLDYTKKNNNWIFTAALDRRGKARNYVNLKAFLVALEELPLCSRPLNQPRTSQVIPGIIQGR